MKFFITWPFRNEYPFVLFLSTGSINDLTLHVTRQLLYRSISYLSVRGERENSGSQPSLTLSEHS